MNVHTQCWVVNSIDPNVIMDEESIIRHLKDVFNLNLLSRLQKFVLVVTGRSSLKSWKSRDTKPP